jgi:hypothetical protein
MTVDNLTDLNPPHVCACPYPGSVFSYVMVFFSVQCVKMKGDCWVFFDVGGIVDHHSLKYPFIIK